MINLPTARPTDIIPAQQLPVDMATVSPSVIAIAEAESKRYIYSKLVSPNEIIWLALGLPVSDTSSTSKHLRIKIANTIVFGFGNSGIYLSTGKDGRVQWYAYISISNSS